MFDVIQFLKIFINTAIYTVFGLVIFLITFTAIVKAVPFSVRKEIEEALQIPAADALLTSGKTGEGATQRGNTPTGRMRLHVPRRESGASNCPETTLLALLGPDLH